MLCYFKLFDLLKPNVSSFCKVSKYIFALQESKPKELSFFVNKLKLTILYNVHLIYCVCFINRLYIILTLSNIKLIYHYYTRILPKMISVSIAQSLVSVERNKILISNKLGSTLIFFK